MVLEATIVCVDNSEWMRNGDFPPARLDAQQDAVNLVCSAKLQQNAENTVGLLATAGSSARILVTSTQDAGAIFSSLHSVKLDGSSDLIAGLQKAQLALKHRQNQQQRQRIVVFCGSPVIADEEALVKLGKKLKKNGVAVDVVNFGEQEENVQKLEALIASVQTDENSHLVNVPTGPHVLADILLASPVINESGGYGGATEVAAATAGDGAATDAGGNFIDPSVDPELAMAIRISMQEEQARQEAAAAVAAAENGGAEATAAQPATEMAAPTKADPAAAAPGTQNTDTMDDDADLYGSAQPMEEDGGADEDEELRLALEMSLQESQQEPKKEDE